MANFFSGYLARGSVVSGAFVEETGTTYSRQAVTYGALVGSMASPLGGVTFGPATGAWGAGTARALVDAASNVVAFWAIPPVTVASGGSDTASISDLTLSIPDVAHVVTSAASLMFAAGATIGLSAAGTPIIAGSPVLIGGGVMQNAAAQLGIYQTGQFGTGADGVLVLSSGTTTLTRNGHYSAVSWTVGSTGKIDTNGWVLYVSGTLDLTNIPVGGIFNSGLTGNNAAAATGAAAKVTLQAGTVPGGRNGQAGATGTAAAGTSGTAGAITAGYGGDGGGGGAGGAGTNAAGAAVAANLTTRIQHSDTTIPPSALTSSGGGTSIPIYSAAPGSGGAAGGGDGTNPGGGGGGGGTSPVALAIRAAVIIRAALTPAGAIANIGGNGGTGGTVSTGNVGGGGGGNGSGGGSIDVVAGTILGPTVPNCLDVTAGNGAAGGNGAGTGIGGTGGASGKGGATKVTNLSAGTTTFNTPNAAGTTATAASTTAGTAGGVAPTTRVAL